MPTATNYLPPDELDAEVRRRILPAHTVLDVGSGRNPQSYVPFERMTCLEPHPLYFQELCDRFTLDTRYALLNLTWQRFYPVALFPFDTITSLDSLEHMTKYEGRRFLRLARQRVNQQVIIRTPCGQMPQNYDDPALLVDGMSGLTWQTHRSGWTPEDFEPDWTVLVARDFYWNDGNGNPLPEPMGLLWAIWNKERA